MGVVVATIYGLPELMEPVEAMDQPIIVELVTMAERTVSQKVVEFKPKKAPPPAPLLKPIPALKPKPEPKKVPPPPKLAKAVATPPPEPIKDAAPLPAREPQKPAKAEPAPIPKPVDIAAPKPPPPPVPEKRKKKPKPPIKLAKPKPQKAFRTLPRPRAKPKRRQPQFNTDRIAALLDKGQEKTPRQWQKAVKDLKSSKRQPDRAAPSRSQARSVPMTISEKDAIRYQIQKCWSIPAGARDAENLIVRIKVFLNTDGSLSKAPEIVGGNLTGDPFYRAAAESARRAILKCAPLKNLPADKYSRWREITLTFNPREMLGG